MKKYSKHIINLKNSNNAVSELLGTILLLGIAVAIFSVLYLIVLSQSFDTSEPNPTIVATIEDNYIIFQSSCIQHKNKQWGKLKPSKWAWESKIQPNFPWEYPKTELTQLSWRVYHQACGFYPTPHHYSVSKGFWFR